MKYHHLEVGSTTILSRINEVGEQNFLSLNFNAWLMVMFLLNDSTILHYKDCVGFEFVRIQKSNE